MTKAEAVNYLASLVTVMDFHEKLGTTKNPFLVIEFINAHNELVEIIRKEQEDAERTRHSERVRSEQLEDDGAASEFRRRYDGEGTIVQPAPRPDLSDEPGPRLTRRESRK